VAEARWLEVSITGDGEIAEAVSEVLGRFVSQGVVVESGVRFKDDEDEGTASGQIRVYGYLVVDEHIEDTRQRLIEALWHLGRILPLAEPVFKPIMDEDWMAAWKKHYHPIPIGQKMLILPAWLESSYPERIAVRIDPSMAFGTGTHPTTQLCLELVELYTVPGKPVIDVGCGSGILSIAAVKMGACKALAVDIDNAAVRSTRENAGTNGVLDLVETGQGSIEDIRQRRFSFRRAPLVLANILAPVIVRMFEDGLAELLLPGGVIILSGILWEQMSSVIAASELHGLELIDQRQSGDWVALAFKEKVTPPQ